MTNLTRYTSSDLPTLMEKITRNSIGLDEYFDRLFTLFVESIPKESKTKIQGLRSPSLHETTSNYPPFNLVQLSNVDSRLELALAGFRKNEVYVYTQDGKLFVEGQKEDKETETRYVHKGLAQRSFTRSWTLSDDTEVRSVEFEDGLLTITLGRIVPDHHKRKDYL